MAHEESEQQVSQGNRKGTTETNQAIHESIDPMMFRVYLVIRMHKVAYLCIDVNRCFPSMQVLNSDPSSEEDTAGDKVSRYVTCSFVNTPKMTGGM